MLIKVPCATAEVSIFMIPLNVYIEFKKCGIPKVAIAGSFHSTIEIRALAGRMYLSLPIWNSLSPLKPASESGRSLQYLPVRNSR